VVRRREKGDTITIFKAARVLRERKAIICPLGAQKGITGVRDGEIQARREEKLCGELSSGEGGRQGGLGSLGRSRTSKREC